MENKQFLIREMEEADWKAVAKIYAQGIASGIATFEQVVPSFTKWDETHVRTCRLVFVYDQAIVGWCALSPISSRAVYQGVGEVSLYIAEAYRSKGLGTKLLNALCKMSEAAGFWTLQASIFEDNGASIAMHQKCHFRMVGYRERIGKNHQGIWKNTVLMEHRNKQIEKED